MRLFACLLFAAFLAFNACCPESEDEILTGKRPVYTTYADLVRFEQQAPRPVVRAGKALLYKQYLFLGEVNEGIHVIDIQDTLNPHKLSFLLIPGNKDLSAQDDRLYADNGPHLLVLDISNIHEVKLVDRKKDWFAPSEFFPPDYSGPFECTDYSKGWVTAWQSASLRNPKCDR